MTQYTKCTAQIVEYDVNGFAHSDLQIAHRLLNGLFSCFCTIYNKLGINHALGLNI